MNPGAADKNLLTSPEDRANMTLAEKPANLDNEICAQPAVHVPRTITAANGCRVTLLFNDQTKPGLRKEIALMLLDSFREREGKNYEASVVPVQSFD